MKIHILTIITFSLFFSMAHAQCLEGDCVNGQGTFQFADRMVYEGGFKDGQPQGKGICRYANGSVFDGSWEAGVPQGKGVFTTAGGEAISGTWKNGLLEEPYISKIPPTYTCETGDCKNGNGKIHFSSGSVYEGEFKNGKFHGKGVCQYADGSVYDGYWEDGTIQGMGVFTRTDGEIISGVWKNGQLIKEHPVGLLPPKICETGDCENGQGKARFPDGSVYEGGFKNGKLHGRGIWHYADGSVFDGHWEDGFVHGEGVMTTVKGEIISGVWKNGQLVKSQTTGFLPPKTCETGDCENGEGEARFSDGGVYKGGFKNGRLHGKGIWHYADGSIFDGHWENGVIQGEGVLTTTEGGIISGVWKNGQLASTVRH